MNKENKVKIRIEMNGKVIENEGHCLICAMIESVDDGENASKISGMLIGHDVSPIEIGMTLADLPESILKDLPESANKAYRLRMLENTTDELKERLANKQAHEKATIESGMEGLESDFQSWLKENAEGGAR